MDRSTQGFPVLHHLPVLAQLRFMESVMPSNHLILCHSLLLPTSTFPNIRVFSNESTVQIWWPKYWSFSASISVSNECWELILFRIDWLDLLSDQGTVMSLSKYHSWKASVLRCSIFFLVQLSYPYMTTGKAFALTRQTFVSKVMSLLFNTLFVISFLPRSRCPLISWLQSPCALILEPKKIKSCFCSHCFPISLPRSDGTGCHDLHLSIPSLWTNIYPVVCVFLSPSCYSLKCSPSPALCFLKLLKSALRHYL